MRYAVSVWTKAAPHDGYDAEYEAPDAETARRRFMRDHVGLKGWWAFSRGQGVMVRQVETATVQRRRAA